MELPFTPTQFVDVFAAYNARMWSAALALWVLSLVVLVAAFRGDEPRHRTLSALLAVHWAWSALAYHAAFFTSINPAAWIFAVAFLVQAAGFVWAGVIRGRLAFTSGWSLRHALAGALVTYAFAYPLVTLAEGLTFPRMPTFGLPCPTTIMTAGLLLTARAPSWGIALIPVLWSLVGGSAALLLNVKSDVVLLVTAALLVISIGVSRSRHPVASPRSAAWNPFGVPRPLPCMTQCVVQISPDELDRSLHDQVPPQLIDCRSPGEFAAGHIPGSINIPAEELGPRAHDIDGSRPIVFVCASGSRAASAAAHVGSAVAVLEGGTNAWAATGRELVVNAASTWSLERQVRLVAGSLAALGGLAGLLDPRWAAVPILVGLGLTFAAVTNTCAMASVLMRMPWNRRRA